jgi:outer membrane protein assembly factor BamB
VGTYGGELVTLSTSNGNILHQETLSSWTWQGPAQDGNNIYIGDANGTLYAFPMAGSGQPWTQKLNGAIVGSPLVSDKAIVVGTETGNVYYLDNTGKILQSITVSGKIYTTPAAAKTSNGALVLVAPISGNDVLIALDMNGATLWSFIPAK